MASVPSPLLYVNYDRTNQAAVRKVFVSKRGRRFLNRVVPLSGISGLSFDSTLTVSLLDLVTRTVAQGG